MTSPHRLRLAGAAAAAYGAGFTAALAGQDRGDCPHAERTTPRVWWLAGHADGRRDRMRAEEHAAKVRRSHGGQLGFHQFDRALRRHTSRTSAAEIRLAWESYSGTGAQQRGAA